MRWNEEENIRWKVSLPGLGHSTPIVWGDRIIVTAAIPIGEELEPRYSGAPGAHDNLPVTRRQRFIAVALNPRNGSIVWQRTLNEQLPHEGGHETGSPASASPVTDGERVFVFFGSFGLFCLTMEDGEPVWQADLGRMHSKHGHGEGSSPTLCGEVLIVNWDHEGSSYVIAFDKRTGRQRWKVNRDEVTSWATPLVVEHNGAVQVVISGTGRVRGYDPENGRVIWECGGLSANVVASPVSADGIVIAASSYDTSTMVAIRLDGARGDITGTGQIAWSRVQRTPYVPSPLLEGGAVWFLRHYQGILSRVVTESGEEPTGPFRLGPIRNVYASPVAAAGRIHITDLEGTTLVMTGDARPKLLSINRLDDSFSASAAIVDSQLYLRGRSYLYCVAED